MDKLISVFNDTLSFLFFRKGFMGQPHIVHVT